MKKISKSLLNWLPAITLGIVLGSFLQLTQAWQEPGSNPPDSNIGAPVTTGSASQYKSGALGVNGLLRGYGKVMGNELCFGWDCRSDWQDLYKSGDKVCIESGNCVDVADNYIGDPGTHYAGGNLNMRGKDITNVDDVRLNDIYKYGWGDIDIYDDVDMKGNKITSANSIGIGTNNPREKLHLKGSSVTSMLVEGESTWVIFDDNGPHFTGEWRAGEGHGEFRIGVNDDYSSGWNDVLVADSRANGGRVGINLDKLHPDYHLEVNGTVNADNISNNSDIRLKKNVRRMNNSLEKITSLEGVNFEWKDKDKPGENTGLIAQKVEKFFPEVVHTGEESGMKSVEYGKLVAPIVESIKELNQKNKMLRKKFQEERQENIKQKEKIKEIETKLNLIENKLK